MLAVNVKLNEKDLGLDALVTSLKNVKRDNSALAVGIQFPNRKYADGQDVGTVAAVHEFGAPERNIPAKQFIRGTVARHKNKYASLIGAELARAMRSKRPISLRSVYLQVGPVIKADMQDAIDTFNLIDTGLLRSSVGWRVTKGA